MKAKSETSACFKKFHIQVEKQTGSQVDKLNVIKRSNKSIDEVKALWTDNGGGYISKNFKSYLQQNGILHQLTIAYTPQQNGVAERMNRTLMDCVRSLLHSSNLDNNFWAEALSTAVYIQNRVYSRSLPSKTTLYHRWMRKSPDLSYLRVFGSRCWFVIPKSKLRKLDPRSKEGLVVGYSKQHKGYKIWDVEPSKLIVSRDVTFDEITPNPLKVQILSNVKIPSEPSVPGGDMKEGVDGNIDLNTEPPP